MKVFKGKYLFIEYHIMRYVYPSCLWLKALVSFMHGAIAYEHTLCGPESKLARVIWS
jgi:hypothetical protein